MPYPFEQIFAGDPSAPERVAANGIVTIFEPGDAEMTPLVITTLEGTPYPNPVQVNETGHAAAFQHETLDQVAWAGGGLFGLFSSHKGMKEVAVAAQQGASDAAVNAEQSRLAAEEAVRNAQAPSDEAVDAALIRADLPGTIQQAVSGKLDKGEASSTFAVKPDNGGKPIGKGELVINAGDYGVDGNGITDNSAAIQAAANAAGSAGVALYFPPGRYRCNTSITLPHNISIRGEGFSTVLVQGDPKRAIFTTSIYGEALVGALSADVAMGSNSARLTGYLDNLQPKDIVVVADKYHYDTTVAEVDFATYSGELLEVDSVTSAGVVAFKNKVRGSFHSSRAYTLANQAYLNKINMVKGIDISSLTFEGLQASSIALVRFYYCQDVRLDKLNCVTAGRSFIELQSCKDVAVTNCNVQNLVDNLATSQTGYGVRIQNACDGVIVDTLTANNMRHAVTTTGGGKGIPRRLIFNNITAVNMSTAAGVDTHSAGDDIIISNCVIENCALGIAVRSKNTIVVNNVIRQCNTGVRIAEDMVDNCVIQGNLVEDCGKGVESSGISRGLVVRGNTVRNTGTHGLEFASAFDLFIEGNIVSKLGAHGIRISASCGDVLIKGNTITAWGAKAGGVAIASAPSTPPGGGRADILQNTLISRGAPANTAISFNHMAALITGNIVAGPYTGVRIVSAAESVTTGNFEHA